MAYIWARSVRATEDIETFAPPSGTFTEPIVTDKVYLDIKIANYTEESIGKNRGATGSGKVVIGLYGRDAPQSVKRFLKTVEGDSINTPSYLNCLFSRITPDPLLEMESVRGIQTINIAGTAQYEYKGQLLTDMKPILERNGIRHTR
jgi:hypothetical protein